MKYVTLLVTGILLSFSSYSQNVTYEAVKIAELFVSQYWEQQEKAIPLIIAGVRSQARQRGATEKASNLFVEELGKVLNKDQFIKMYAKVISTNLTQDEMVQLDKFLRSDLGNKFFNLSKDVNLPVLIEPITDKVFQDTCSKLDEVDRASIRCK